MAHFTRFARERFYIYIYTSIYIYRLVYIYIYILIWTKFANSGASSKCFVDCLYILCVHYIILYHHNIYPIIDFIYPIVDIMYIYICMYIHYNYWYMIWYSQIPWFSMAFSLGCSPKDGTDLQLSGGPCEGTLWHCFFFLWWPDWWKWMG